jgi:hypothetical protein
MDRQATTERTPAGNSGFAKKRVQWLIEHSTSHQLLWYVDSLVLRNPLLRKAAKRYFPTAHFKNNFSQPHIGTFAKPHEPTHKPSFTKEPIFHAQKNILDKYIHYSRKVLIFAQIKSKICFQRLVNMVLEHQFSLQSNLCLTEK